MQKIKKFFIKLFRVPVNIYIEWDRKAKVYKLWTGKPNPDIIHFYTGIRPLKGGIYNILLDIEDRPFTLVCSQRILRRLFEPERDKWDI